MPLTATPTPLKPPFPWFGGKSRAAHLIWQGFGDCPNYVEPFFGSGATLFRRPDYDPIRHTETVNDFDCYLANFWRALQTDPQAVAHWADSPVNEADLHARHLWLINQGEFRERMATDPDYFDVKVAGWWVWGVCAWIGAGWCANLPLIACDDDLGGNGRGVHRKPPHLGNNGMGVHRKRPHLAGCKPDGLRLAEQGVGASPASDLYAYFEALADRLRRVRVCCGDWKRVLGPAPTEKLGITGVLLDPPYNQALREDDLYSVETPVSDEVREWAIANGGNPKLRIALCGYVDEHAMPDDWQCVEWKAGGGYDGQKRDRSNQNRKKERIWFSPHCLPVYSDVQVLAVIEQMRGYGRAITREQAIAALKAS